MNQELRIRNEEIGKRLDLFLTKKLQEYSRSQIQKMVKEGVITVNERKVAPHHFLKEGDSIEMRSGTGHNQELRIKNQAVVTGPDPIFSPRIITETPDYIILDKPAGMVVHQSEAMLRRSHGEGEPPTLADWILEKYPEIRKVGDDPLRPGIVHRLDKDASGIMVVARTNESFDSLVRQFKLRQVVKRYRIVTFGRVIPKEGTIDVPISRSKTNYTKQAAGSHGTRSALTRYHVEEYLKKYSLVRVMPETGRTHQIRVHFFSKGNPIVGDMIYTPRKKGGKIAPKPFREGGRLMLHAEHLAFRDLSGEAREYTVLPGEDFEKNLAELRVA
ncbi:RluA family pseudouridine synthase [Candidatus Uhrbacteria bacterium]|nr:RluA family pseudouridine synthase [Candidatus Uhrbacteria bacterium]